MAQQQNFSKYLKKTHTVLLVSETPQNKSYTVHNSTIKALEQVINLYERKLKEMNPQATNITYDISDLNNYIDSLSDMTMMVLDERQGLYEGLAR
eukprot:CAMPEP_0205906206 /NCGR_PEP_ID=MMETSP1325-20131115/1814_1 /ASSEMBLY_ACC=CAM_ASM_000708 /TAXON_ID=236786 /ORGANISM="Florenciella sp., Strain RCC1007" /LENGTH=94 /DNA_ID=CAMNT_0053272203 /DNA_START=28 /DNA_END=309 /DNA_ORIENTATION=+